MIRKVDESVSSKVTSSYRISNLRHCVEELCYNSIDANATAIAVRVDLTKFDVQVIDKGEGISDLDLQTIGERCFTSKSDKQTKLGFKGDFLVSLVQVSKHVIIESKSSSSQKSTWRKRFSDGHVASIKKAKVESACTGTTVTVKGLFNGLPLRRLDRNCEMSSLVELMTSMSIGHPSISFSLRDETLATVLLQMRRMGDSAKTFKALFPNDYPSGLRDSGGETVKVGNYSGRLYLGDELSRQSTLQFVFINGRPIFNSKLHRTVSANLRIDSDEESQGNAVFILKLFCKRSNFEAFDSESGETFAHFQSFNDVERLIRILLSKVGIPATREKSPDVEPDSQKGSLDENFLSILRKSDSKMAKFIKNPKAAVEQVTKDEFVFPSELKESCEEIQVEKEAKKAKNDMGIGDDWFPSKRMDSLITTARLPRIRHFVNAGKTEVADNIGFCCKGLIENLGIWQTMIDVDSDNTVTSISNEFEARADCKSVDSVSGVRITKEMLRNVRVITQLEKKFIVAVVDDMNASLLDDCEKTDTPKLLLIFDQHAVSERVHLESLYDEYSSADIDLVSLKLDKSNIRYLVDFKEIFEKLAISFECSGNDVRIVKVPQLLHLKYSVNLESLERNLYNMIIEIIEQLKCTQGSLGKFWLPKIMQDILNSMACRSAVMFGDELTIVECEQLLERLTRCRMPFECAHGRPTVFPLADIGKFYL